MTHIQWSLLSYLVISMFVVVSSQMVCNIEKTSNGKPCNIPFTYRGQMYSACTKTGAGSQYWCATTADYDTDRESGICTCTNQGITSTTAQPPSTTHGGPCTPTVIGGAPCAASYVYKGVTYTGCNNLDNKGVYWCSLTSNYGADQRWGNCENTCIFDGQTTTTTSAPPVTATTSASTSTPAPPTTPTTQGTSATTSSTTTAANLAKRNARGCIVYIEGSVDTCYFPFTYKGVVYTSCTSIEENRAWCSKTAIYAKSWGFCGTEDCSGVNTPVPTPAPTATPVPSNGVRRNDRGCIVYIEGSVETCHFPFTYNNVVYTSCTRINGDKPWCSKTEVYVQLWGYCGTEDCSDNNIPVVTPAPAPVNCAAGKVQINRINVTTATRTQRVPIRIEGCFGDIQPTGVFFESPEYSCTQKIGGWVKGVIECTTPGNIPEEKTTELMQIFIRLGTIQNVPTRQYFNFRASSNEPYITSIPDLTTIAGGNVKALLTGGNLLPGLNAAPPSLRMTVDINSKKSKYYEKVCTALDETTIQCRTPPISEDEVNSLLTKVEPDSTGSTTIKVNIPGKIDFVPGVLLGTSTKYLNFSKIFPGSSPVNVYKDPQIYARKTSDPVPYRKFAPFSDDEIKIPGKYLNTMFDRSDYLVSVGGDQNTCEITQLKSDYIVCKPKNTPKTADGETITKPKVQVKILPLDNIFPAMTLNYQETFIDFQEGFAGVVGGGAALILIILVVVIVCCMVRSRRNQNQNDDYVKHLDSVQSTPRGSTGMNGFKYNSHAPMYTSPRKSRHSSRGTSRSRPREPTPNSSRSTSRSTSRTGSLKSYKSQQPDFAY